MGDGVGGGGVRMGGGLGRGVAGGSGAAVDGGGAGTDAAGVAGVPGVAVGAARPAAARWGFAAARLCRRRRGGWWGWSTGDELELVYDYGCG